MKAETPLGEAQAAVIKAEGAVEEAKADWMIRPDDSFLKRIYQQALGELAQRRATLDQLLLRTSGYASARSQVCSEFCFC